MNEARMGSLKDKIYENPVKKNKFGGSRRATELKKDNKKKNEK